MSTVVSTEIRSVPSVAEGNRLPTRRGLLAWSLVTSGVLLGGGALRLITAESSQPGDLTVVSPFRLKLVPQSLGDWRLVEGSDTLLDPLTTRITGSTEHLIRTYFDEATGTTLSALILYGPAEPVLPHTPQICYPASGYRALRDPVDRKVRVDDRLTAVFRSGVFAKSGGRTVVRQSVYHSYRLDGVWSPDVTDRSLPRRRAGLFKVQIQRRILDGERINSDEPIEAFLQVLLPTLERLIAAPPTEVDAGSARS